ncbi:hypothetical protein M405DRAFT_878799 [Rhizopogon salebrosus TDB-379]|nr:hypothetical protein M405DRAFT_878799 [Rhizopogon salebrosus TDB-379]
MPDPPLLKLSTACGAQLLPPPMWHDYCAFTRPTLSITAQALVSSTFRLRITLPMMPDTLSPSHSIRHLKPRPRYSPPIAPPCCLPFRIQPSFCTPATFRLPASQCRSPAVHCSHSYNETPRAYTMFPCCCALLPLFPQCDAMPSLIVFAV